MSVPNGNHAMSRVRPAPVVPISPDATSVVASADALVRMRMDDHVAMAAIAASNDLVSS